MKLPVIRHLSEVIEESDATKVENTIEVLESLADVRSITDQELDVIGELLSNLYGAVEVHKDIQSGSSKKDALNGFMIRVMGSIDQ